MKNRDKIAATIRALLAKTVANGCTEDEAVAAAAKAAELLERYNLSLDEVELRETPFTRHDAQHDDEVGERLWKVADGIAHLTGCRYWVTPPGARVQVSFFGFAHEVEIAGYLLEICARAMRQQEAQLNRQFALLVPARRRRKILPFLDGMADRLGERIRELKPPAPTGTGIVVVRDALLNAAMKDIGVSLVDRSTRGSRDFEDTYLHGRAAADRVALNRGMTGSRAALLLR